MSTPTPCMKCWSCTLVKHTLIHCWRIFPLSGITQATHFSTLGNVINPFLAHSTDPNLPNGLFLSVILAGKLRLTLGHVLWLVRVLILSLLVHYTRSLICSLYSLWTLHLTLIHLSVPSLTKNFLEYQMYDTRNWSDYAANYANKRVTQKGSSLYLGVFSELNLYLFVQLQGVFVHVAWINGYTLVFVKLHLFCFIFIWFGRYCTHSKPISCWKICEYQIHS